MRYRHQRFPADTEVRVMYENQSESVELVNISATGARLLVPDGLPEGALVHLCYLHTRIPARVVWSDDVRTGLSFVTPLSSNDLNALRGAGGRLGGSWGSSAPGSFREL